MKALKRNVFIIFMSILVTFYAVEQPCVEASAAAVVAEEVLGVVEGAGTIAGAGALTVSGALLLVGATVLVCYGSKLVYDNWDDITNTAANAYKNSTGAVKTWWDGMTSNAISVSDNSRTLAQDIADGKTINYNDYFLPLGYDLYVTSDVANCTATTIENKYGYTDLKPQIVTSETSVKKWFQTVGITTYNTDFINSTYPFIMITKKTINGNIVYWVFACTVPFVVGREYFYNLGKSYFTINPPSHVIGASGYYESYVNGSICSSRSLSCFGSGTDTTAFNINTTDYSSSQTMETAIELHNIGQNNIVYCNNPVQMMDYAKTDGQTVETVPSKSFEYTINQSAYSLKDNTFADTKIDCNSYVVNQIKALDIPENNIDTDTVVGAIDKADTIAEAAGSNVTTNDIATVNPTSSDIPDTNSGLLDGIKDFLWGLLQAIISLLTAIKDAVLSINPVAIATAIYNLFTSALEAIKDVLGNIKDGILDIPQDIINLGGTIGEFIGNVVDGITDLPGHIWDGFCDAMTKVFVPSSAAVNEFVTEATNTTELKGGLLTYPIELVIEFLSKVNNLGVADCIIKIPKIEFKGHVLYGGYSFDFTDEVKKSEYANIYEKYRLITNFIMIIALVGLAVKKGEELMTGGLKGD